MPELQSALKNLKLMSNFSHPPYFYKEHLKIEIEDK